MLIDPWGKMWCFVSAGVTTSVSSDRDRVREEIGTGAYCSERGGAFVGGWRIAFGERLADGTNPVGGI